MSEVFLIVGLVLLLIASVGLIVSDWKHPGKFQGGAAWDSENEKEDW